MISSSDPGNHAIQGKVVAYCTSWGSLYMQVAQLRDQGIPPQTVLNSLLRSNLPDDVKKEAPTIINLVYVKFANIPPEEIGPAVYGACMELNTGIRREA